MSFFDLDNLLAGHQRIQCTFDKTVPKLGFFDPNSKGDDIEEGAKVDLPNWLAHDLFKSRHSIVSVEIPKSYGAACRAIIDADAHVVDLNKLGPFFYVMGIDLLSYATPEMGDLGKMLIQAFTGRFRWLMDKGLNSAGEDKQSLMDRTEMKLYAAAQYAAKAYDRWMSRESELLMAPDAAPVQKRFRSL